MIIIYNPIALGIEIVSLLLAFAVGRILGITDPSRIFLLGAPIAGVLDLIYRGRTGRWFHPRAGGRYFSFHCGASGSFRCR